MQISHPHVKYGGYSKPIPIGVTSHSTGSNPIDFTFSPESFDEFWRLHEEYHKSRPAAVTDTVDEDDPSESDPSESDDKGGDDKSKDNVKKDQSGEGGCSTSDKAFNISFYKNHSFENGNAPWGKTEGGEIIGLEVPLLSNFNWDSCSDTSSDDGLHIQGCEVENDLVLTLTDFDGNLDDSTAEVENLLSNMVVNASTKVYCLNLGNNASF